MTDTPLLEVRDLVKHFPARRRLIDYVIGRQRRTVHAVNGVSLDLRRGETLALVGESGCGKSTLGRCIVGLFEPTAGEVRIDGVSLPAFADRLARARKVQMIFQDPYASLNPSLTVEQALAEIFRVHGLANGKKAVDDRIDELLTLVGLGPALRRRRPKAFSGGQRQRLSIARALAVEPDLIIADEPVSALDVSIRAQIINLFQDLQERLGLGLLFVAHDLHLVRQISHRVAVMYLGRVVEMADAEALFAAPRHPYTRALISAVPFPDPARRTAAVGLQGEPPSPFDLPSGCSFGGRCPNMVPDCKADIPQLVAIAPGHFVRCLRADP